MKRNPVIHLTVAAAAWLATAGALLLPLCAGAEESEAAREARIAAMSAEQKARLLQKKERFDALSDQEQQRLRALHAEISRQPNAAALEASLKGYSQWLQTLSAAQQAEVMGLPLDKRLDKIRAIRQEQIQDHFAELAWQLDKADLDTIHAWMVEFVSRHDDEILERMDPNWAVRAISTKNPKEREAILVGAVFGFPRNRGSRLPLPTADDFRALEPQLSESFRAELATHTNENRRDLVMACARYAHFSRFAPPPPTDDQLREFYSNLDAEKRERLDKLDRQQMKRELTREYLRQPFRRGSEAGPPPGRGGPAPRPGRPGPGPG